MVMHVHGAHVGPGSDGYPEAWWLPAANDIPAGYATNGTFFESANGADTANAIGQGYALDMYPNDQPTTTLWYHDHSLGMTRLNVYAAGAGFWMIRDALDGETGVIAGVLPGPAPKAGDSAAALNTPGDPVRSAVREIPHRDPAEVVQRRRHPVLPGRPRLLRGPGHRWYLSPTTPT